MIPGNDDAIRSCKLIIEAIGDVAAERCVGLPPGGGGAPEGRGGAQARRGRGAPEREAEEKARVEAEEKARQEAIAAGEIQEEPQAPQPAPVRGTCRRRG